MLRATPLNESHRAAGARMVDFGGWEMPLHYGSQLEEHHAVRRHAGLFDVSHMQAVEIEGAGARGFLRRVLANDVARLATPGRALYSCMLGHDGGVIDDLIAYFFREDWFRLVVNAGTAAKDIAWLRQVQQAESPGVTIRPREDFAILALQGPQARAIAWDALPSLRDAAEPLAPFHAALAGDTMVARTGYTGEEGFELVMPAASAAGAWQALVASGARPAGLGARDTLRLEAGMNLYGQDMDERVSPLDAGLAWTVDRSQPRDFIGREALERDGQRHQFAGLLLTGSGGVLRAHQAVAHPAGAGEITSGTFSPTLGKSIALARLPLAARVGDAVQVRVRDKALDARVVKPPFVRHGKILVS